MSFSGYCLCGIEQTTETVGVIDLPWFGRQTDEEIVAETGLYCRACGIIFVTSPIATGPAKVVGRDERLLRLDSVGGFVMFDMFGRPVARQCKPRSQSSLESLLGV